MLLHMVMIKWKEGTSTSQIEAMAAEIKDLGQIEGVTNLASGPILKNLNTNYDFVVSMELPSQEFLEKTYLPHPTHKRVEASLLKILGAIIGADAGV